MNRRGQVSIGVLFALGSIFAIQTGAAASMPLFAQVGPAGTAWLRLCWAALIFIAIARPRPWAMARRDLLSAGALGVVSAGVTLFCFEAIARIPLATVVSIEFLGPLTVAVLRRSGRWGLAWPPLALAGVLLVTQPWYGVTSVVGIVFIFGAAACWAGYILLTQHVGDRFHGVDGLAISIPVAALVATPFGAPSALTHLTLVVVVKAAGLALLSPVIPYALELFALRRLPTATFGTLMSVEPAAALIVGAVLLEQIPNAGQIVGILLVTAAAIGAARTGARTEPPPACAALPAGQT
ncbi:MAG TPA: EamA family transporter [Polyangiaceae bacterium]|nr:EamA family transporter [Polyangiaceae bacterium]